MCDWRRAGRPLHVRAGTRLGTLSPPHQGARDGEDFVLNGQEMWLTSGGTASLVAVPYQAGDGHDVQHRNMATFLIEKETRLRREPSGPRPHRARQDRQDGLIHPGQARSTALFQLASELPAALLARMLGIHIDVATTRLLDLQDPVELPDPVPVVGSAQPIGRRLDGLRRRHQPPEPAITASTSPRRPRTPRHSKAGYSDSSNT